MLPSTPSSPLPAGRVGRAHGLDGSFYVTGARPRLLEVGSIVSVGGRSRKIARRSGTDERPILRVEGIDDRAAAESMRGRELTVEYENAPALDAGEWWAGELEGCEVWDGDRSIGVVTRLVELPSCEALEVDLRAHRVAGEEARDADRAQAHALLVPMVSDAVRSVDVERGRIDVDMSFLEGR